MELIDILDENGDQTGFVESRDEVYKKGLWHRSCHIWIENDNKELLVQKRNPNKKTYPNLWSVSVAGHVTAGESSKMAAIRELKEEVDLDVKEEELEYLFTIKRNQDLDDNHLRVFDDVYLLHKNIDIEKTKLQVEELTDIKFVYYQYLKNIYYENDPDYVPANEEQDKLFTLLEERYQEV